MDAEALADWLETRLTSDTAEAEWTEVLTSAVQHALERPLGALWPEEAFLDALRPHLTPDRLADGARFAVREVLARSVEEARNDEAPVGRWLDPEATAQLTALAASPGWVDRAWIDRLFQEEAMEALVSDTLYEALRDFSTLVPRIVQGVLPAGIGRLAKLGGKATGGVGGKVIEEVERRLEAEIRRFLDRGTRRALERAASFCGERIDNPQSAQARRHLVTFALAQSGAFHAQPLDDARLEQVETAAVAAVRSIGQREELDAVLSRVVARFYEARGQLPLSDALRQAGVDPESFPVDTWARASWPAVRGVLRTPEAKSFLTRLSHEILEVIPKS